MNTATTASAAATNYIHPRNQTLLWETIQRCNLLTEVVQDPTAWFRAIVQQFYEEEVANPVLGMPLYDAVKSINERTLFHMVEDLRDRKLKIVSMQAAGRGGAAAAAAFTKSADPFTAMEQNQTFHQVNMVKNENKIKFELESDGPIKNMDELLLQQSQMRDRDMTEFARAMPPPAPP